MNLLLFRIDCSSLVVSQHWLLDTNLGKGSPSFCNLSCSPHSCPPATWVAPPTSERRCPTSRTTYPLSCLLPLPSRLRARKSSRTSVPSLTEVRRTDTPLDYFELTHAHIFRYGVLWWMRLFKYLDWMLSALLVLASLKSVHETLSLERQKLQEAWETSNEPRSNTLAVVREVPPGFAMFDCFILFFLLISRSQSPACTVPRATLCGRFCCGVLWRQWWHRLGEFLWGFWWIWTQRWKHHQLWTGGGTQWVQQPI